jgi:hypothetical protein
MGLNLDLDMGDRMKLETMVLEIQMIGPERLYMYEDRFLELMVVIDRIK